MKNQKTLSGVAYMFLGAVLLVSGASLQEQMDRLAADPELQLAKAMYVSMFNRSVSAKTEFLAGNSSPAPIQFEYATAPMAAPVMAKRVKVAVAPRMEVIDVVVPEVPNVEVEIAELPKKLAPVRPSRVQIELLKVRARMAALQSLPEHFKFTYFAPATPVPPTPAIDMERLIVVETARPNISTCEKAVTTEAETEL